MAKPRLPGLVLLAEMSVALSSLYLPSLAVLVLSPEGTEACLGGWSTGSSTPGSCSLG